MKPSLLVSKGTLFRTIQAAKEFWNKRQFEEAIDCLERAARLAPANCDLITDLGKAYGLRYEFGKAEECFDKAIRLSSNKLTTLLNIARCSRQFSDFSIPEKYFSQLLRYPQMSADAYAQFADFYERLNRRGEAEVLVEKALHLEADFAPALIIKAKLNRFRGNITLSESLLRRALSSRIEFDAQVKALYELGHVLDQLGNYDEAMASFVGAKTLLIPKAAPYLQELSIVRTQLRNLRNQITYEHVRTWQKNAAMLKERIPITLLAGHPRSGTTLLEQLLQTSTQTASLEETDIFFDEAFMPLERNSPVGSSILSVLNAPDNTLLESCRAHYLSSAAKHLNKSLKDLLLIDKNPSLTFLIPHFLRIFPEARFLVAIRDPRDVCISCFMQPILPLRQGSAAYLTIEGTIADYCELISMYQTLKPWLCDCLLEVPYESVVQSFEATSREILKFLGLSWTEDVLRFNEHAQKRIVRSPTYADVTKPVFKTAVNRWMHYEKYLQPYLDKLKPYVAALGYD